MLKHIFLVSSSNITWALRRVISHTPSLFQHHVHADNKENIKARNIIVTQGIHDNYDRRNRNQIHIDGTKTRYADERVRICLPAV